MIHTNKMFCCIYMFKKFSCCFNVHSIIISFIRTRASSKNKDSAMWHTGRKQTIYFFNNIGEKHIFTTSGDVTYKTTFICINKLCIATYNIHTKSIFSML